MYGTIRKGDMTIDELYRKLLRIGRRANYRPKELRRKFLDALPLPWLKKAEDIGEHLPLDKLAKKLYEIELRRIARHKRDRIPDPLVSQRASREIYETLPIHSKSYIIPTFSKAPEALDPPKEKQDSSSQQLIKTEEWLDIALNAGKGNKLGDLLSNRYPPSWTKLENLLNQANYDREIAIECGNRLAHKCFILDKNNKHMQQDLNRSNKDKKKLSKHIYQLINEVKQLCLKLDTLTSQITCNNISLNKYKDKIRTKLKEMKALQYKIKNDLSMKKSEINSLRVELSALKSNLASKNSELEHMKNMLASKNKQDKIGGKTDEKNEDNILVIQSPPKDLDSLSLAKYFVYSLGRENSQVDRDIQESLTQQTLTSLNNNISKESEISNEKQINGQVQSNISPKISPELSSHIISEIKNNNSKASAKTHIPIREIEALPVVILGASEAL
ncbi:10349_t:CDS:2, partial [Gigaspora margarita]